MTTSPSLIDALRSDLATTAISAPLYHQLRRRLRHAVESGMLQVGDALPSERDLADALGLSRVTVRKAISGLVNEGLLTQQQGAGTFVAPRVEQALSLLTSFSEDMRARGMTPGAEWLDCDTGLANPEEALALDLSPGTEVSRVSRLRTANGKPMTLEHTTVPRSLLPDPAVIGESLYEYLIAEGHRPVRALQRLHARAADDDEARLLAVPPGSPTLYIERRAFLSSGQVIEFTRSLYRGDAYDFVVELRVEDQAPCQ
ncbi:MAG: GntR family transcriptional regulator [Alphaproteobacteria bacterium]|nr:GntR family transcriptional regulator [Alphaproteobacteria bacterium]